MAHPWHICTILAPFKQRTLWSIKQIMPQSDDPRHNLRMTPALKAKLAHAAIDNGRSMNAEILSRLAGSFDPNPAALIAEALRPLAFLSEADQLEAVEKFAEAARILASANAGTVRDR